MTVQASSAFSREAGQVLHAPYFISDAPEFDTPEEHIAWREELSAERDLLMEELANCEAYSDLSPDAKAIYDKAFATFEQPQPVAEEQQA